MLVPFAGWTQIPTFKELGVLFVHMAGVEVRCSVWPSLSTFWTSMGIATKCRLDPCSIRPSSGNICCKSTSPPQKVGNILSFLTETRPTGYVFVYPGHFSRCLDAHMFPYQSVRTPRGLVPFAGNIFVIQSIPCRSLRKYSPTGQLDRIVFPQAKFVLSSCCSDSLEEL